MKKTYVILGICLSISPTLFSQIKQLKAPVKNNAPVVQMQPVKPATVHAGNATPPAVNTDIQTASVTFKTGDDGKDGDTQIGAELWDNNKRAASYYNMHGGTFLGVASNFAEYYTGSTETVPMTVQTSVPTGKIQMVGSLPLPVLRMATPADFNNGGELRIVIKPNGHDTWKINSITLHVSFNNDNGSPHTITWNNITLSQNSRYTDLLFDKNFNPVQ